MRRKVIRKMTALLLAAVMCSGLCENLSANAQEADAWTTEQTKKKSIQAEESSAEEHEKQGALEAEVQGNAEQKEQKVDEEVQRNAEQEEQKVYEEVQGNAEQEEQKVYEEVQGNEKSRKLSGQAEDKEEAVVQEDQNTKNTDLLMNAKTSASELNAPRIVTDSGMKAGQNVTWDCVWFGSYPQAEVVPSATDYTAVSKDILKEGDIIADNSLYSALKNASEWDKNNDITIDGNSYRRVKKEDATTWASNLLSSFYSWSDDSTYHYFKYEPIKWRVLETDGSQVLLLSDMALDDQKYHTVQTSVTWKTSTIRSWLNGYGASDNQQRINYSSRNFIDSAFTSDEKSAIKNTLVENIDNISYGTEGGDDTVDKIFLLSESEVYGENAVAYGFVTEKDTYDEARRSRSSTYAKAMGVESNTENIYKDNCCWWLRSPGNYSYYAAEVGSRGGINSKGGYVQGGCDSVRPSLNLNLLSNQWSYAGTVSSDGTVEIPNLNTGQMPSQNNLTEKEKFFIKEHMDFVNSKAYEERMASCWSEVISKGLDTAPAKVAENIYNVLNTGSELISCKALSIFDNPYDAVLQDLILSQTETSLNKYEMQVKNKLGTYVSMLQDFCKMNSDQWALDTNYTTSLEKLARIIEDPKSFDTEDPFYKLCLECFGNFYDSGQIQDFLNAYGKASDFVSAFNKYANVIEWVSDCINYNALVSAYLDTSDEFKASLVAASVFMEQNAYDVSKEFSVSRLIYTGQFSAAVEKYTSFLTEEKVASLLFETYFTDGIKRVGNVFGDTITKSAISYFSEGLGLSETTASWIFACVTAYKYGWKISDAITKNGTNFDCREYARACYFFEEALAEVVDASGSVLKEGNLQAAKNFDAAYTALQNLEYCSLKNYIKYLENQQEAFLQCLLHPFNSKWNASEIEDVNFFLTEWEDACCHTLKDSKPTRSSISSVKINCPTNVFVYDRLSNLVLSIENNEVTMESRGLAASVVGEAKILAIPDISSYRIDIKATDDGVMHYNVDTYQADSLKLIQATNYSNVKLTKDNLYTGINTEINTGGIPKLMDGKTELTPSGTLTNIVEKVYVSAISISGNTSELSVGDTAVLSANILPKNTYCPNVSWTSSDKEVVTINEEGKLTAIGEGTADIFCTAIDGSGIFDTQSITIKPTIAPTNTPSITPTNTPSVTPTDTPSVTPTNTPSVTPTNTPSVTPTNTPSVTPTDTPSVTPTNTPSVTPTDFPSQTQKIIATPSSLKLYVEGKSKQLSIYNAKGKITYSNSNPKVIKINPKGKVTPLSKGKATITVTAAGDAYYKTASKKINVTVYGKPAKVKSVKAVPGKSKRTLKVSWKKASSVSGYIIKYSYNKNMKNSKTVKVNGGNNTSKTIKKLTSKKYVYIQVQAYKKDGNAQIKGTRSKKTKSKGKIK